MNNVSHLWARFPNREKGRYYEGPRVVRFLGGHHRRLAMVMTRERQSLLASGIIRGRAIVLI
jgi:hypothetical protein